MKTRRWERHGIIKAFGQWAVTVFGVENLTGPCSYEIDRQALANVWWSDHMREKSWVIAADFDAALAYGRQHFGIKRLGGVLW